MKRDAAPTAAIALVALLIVIGGASLGASAETARVTARPDVPHPVRAVAEAAKAPSQGAGTALVSRRVDVGPTVDGVFDGVWSSTELLSVPLTAGREGSATVLEVALGSVYTHDTLYFWAQWPESEPLKSGSTRNKLTLHFDIPEPWPGARDVTCLVACHTAFASDGGSIAHLLGETIPPGRTDPLPAAGAWQEGMWRLEWSRPLISENGFDVQFKALDRAYPFFTKVFSWEEGLADPISADCLLVFGP